ncbi:hypothetical protein [Ensifer canadensis]|uniref:hypothetical protein n=1 Tax=Ensifer canadensis TaxID=555315 RepID=UPI0014906D31|nr:hypothetical protein [Ensifer canadensis]
MSLFTKTANDTFAPYNSDGTARAIVPQEAQVWGTEVELLITAFQAGGGIMFPNKATMDATLTYAANQQAWVMGDATVANNGIYRKIGASGTGSWTRMGDLPFSFIIASDVGAGTADAIHATTSMPVSSSALVWTNIFEANTSSPVTISFNSGAPLTIKTNSGNDVVAGGLVAGMIVMGIVSGSTFRLVSDQASAAIVAAAEAAQVAAEAAAAAAQGVGTAVAVWPSGTLRTMKQRATDVYCILDAPGSPDPTGVNDSTTALVAMAAEGVDMLVTKGLWVCTQKLFVPDYVALHGQGRGYDYEHHTKIMFSGAVTREHAIAGVTSVAVANSETNANGAAYLADSGTRGDNYSSLALTSNFSAGIILGKASVLENIGIFPALNGGLSDYTNSASTAMSDDIDVGIWARNADGFRISGVTCQGHWRKAGLLITSSDIGDGKTPSNEAGYVEQSRFSGFRGVAIRSPDTPGSNFGFGGLTFMRNKIQPLNHQCQHLATSSQLATPFASPSFCMEISGGGNLPRGVNFTNNTLQGRDDGMIFFGDVQEAVFLGNYLESMNVKVSGSWLTDGEGSRIVATADTDDIWFKGNTQFSVDFHPKQTRDSSLSTSRYRSSLTYAGACHSDSIIYDDDYSLRNFISTMGVRMQNGSQAYVVSKADGSDGLRVNPSGQIVGTLYDSGTITIADDAAASLPPIKKGGMIAITCCGSTEDGNFPDGLRSGIVFYDVGTATFRATKFSAGGTNFLTVDTDVTGTTGTDGNVTVGVIADNIRIENRAGSTQVFRYTFLA